MNIVIISGSPRQESLTRRVAKYLKQQLISQAVEVRLIDLANWNLPPVQSVWRAPSDAPVEFQELASMMESADAYVLVTPEYNGSYSPAMKNLLDHFPKRTHKPFGLVTASPGALGGMRAAQQLLLLVPALFGIASPHLLIVPGVDKKFDEQGNLLDPGFESTTNTFLKEFIWLCERLVPAEINA